MVRLQIKTGFVLVLLAILMTGAFMVSQTSASDFVPSQDTTRPNIWSWGYTGQPNASEAFSVWANVTDNEGGVGIENVTINILGPNVTVNDLMTFNGSFYEADVEAFPNPGEFWMQVSAIDQDNNTRDSSFIIITVEEDEEPTVDPLLTLPYVVSLSVVIAVITMMFALMYERREEELAESKSSFEADSPEITDS